MKKTNASIAALLFFSPHLVGADPLTVRTGEHENFTRVVISLPNDSGWKILEEDSQIRLRIDDNNNGYDLSSAFTRISRSRVLDMSTVENELLITRNCQCKVEAYEEPAGLLIMDIKDPLEPLVSLESPPTSTLETQETIASLNGRFDFGELLWDSNASFAPPGQHDLAQVQSDADRTPVEDKPNAEIFLAESLEVLSSQIGDATTRGILTPVVNSTAVVTPETIEQSPTPRETILLPDPAQDLPSTNLRITSSQDVLNGPGREAISPMGRSCPDPMDFEVEKWGGEKSFQNEIGPARAALFNEFDNPNMRYIETLARLYLYYGFGAEASRIVDQFGRSRPEFQYLSAIAEIIDKGSLKQSNTLAGFQDCPTNVSLWAILADDTADQSKEINADAVIRAFEKLPMHLRTHIGPTLINRLTELDHQSGAMSLVRNLQRLTNPDTETTTLSRAQATISVDMDLDANTSLDEVANSNSPYAPLALIRVVDQRLEAGQDVPADIALLVEAYAMELSDGKFGPEMARAHILASAKSGQFDKAFDALEQAKTLPETNEDIRSIVVGELTHDATDGIFANLFFREILNSKELLQVNVAIDAASRVFELGFQDAATEFLSAYEDVSDTEAGALLLAKIALEKGDPLLALKHLEKNTSPESNRILAAAFLQTGAVEQAYQLFHSSGNPEEATLSAWLSDQWQELISPDTPVFENALRVSKSSIEPVDEENRLLTTSRIALEESLQARDDLSRFLTDVPFPD